MLWSDHPPLPITFSFPTLSFALRATVIVCPVVSRTKLSLSLIILAQTSDSGATSTSTVRVHNCTALHILLLHCTCSSAPSSAYNPALSTIPSIIHAMPRIICALLGIIICALCTVEYNNLCTSEYNNPPRDKDRTEPCNLLAGSAAAH